MTYEQFEEVAGIEWLEIQDWSTLPFYAQQGEGPVEGPYVTRHSPNRLVRVSDRAAWAMCMWEAKESGVTLMPFNNDQSESTNAAFMCSKYYY